MPSDEAALAEAVGRLTEEVSQLKSQLWAKEQEVRAARRAGRWADTGYTVWGVVMWAALVWAGAGPFGYIVWSALTASDQITHCQVVADRSNLTGGPTGAFQLVGVVEWEEDEVLGVFPRLQDAAWAAKELSCPLRPIGREE
jgi:hypothetical protein